MADIKAAARDDGVPNGTLVLGSLETAAALRLAPLLAEFARTYPQVRLVLTTGSTGELVDEVIACRLDGAFITGPLSHPDLHQEILCREELVLVTSPSIRSPFELPQVPDLKTIVFRIGCSYRQRLESLLTGLGILTARPLEFGSLDTIVSCVSAGVGVTLLSRGVVADAWRDGRVAAHELPPARSDAETLFVRRTDAYVSGAMSAFLKLARSRSPLRRTGARALL